MNRATYFCLASVVAFLVDPTLATESGTLRSQEQERVTLPSENPGQWSKPWRVVPPDYPTSSLRQGRTSIVDVRAEIDAAGSGKIIEIRAEPADSAFIEAVERVFEFWRFHVGTDQRCRPQVGTFNTRIWFDIENGKPKVSFSALQEPPAPSDPTKPYAKVANGESLVRSLERLMPPNFSAEVVVYLKISVDPASGKAQSLSVVERAGGGSGMRDAVSALQRAYMNAQFDVPPQFRDRAIDVCHVVSFR